MEIKPVPNPTKIATKWALINLLAQIIVNYGAQLCGLPFDSPIKAVAYIPMILFLILTQKEYKEQLGGYITFNQGFSAGFRYSVFGGLLLGLFMGLYMGILSPEYYAQSLDATSAKLLAKGMTQEQVDSAIQIGKKWGPIGGAFGAAVGYAIFGAIVSLIGAAIFKKEKSPLQIADELDNTDATV